MLGDCLVEWRGDLDQSVMRGKDICLFVHADDGNETLGGNVVY